MALRLITPPAALPVTVEEFKAYARIERADQDVMLESLLRAASTAITRRLNHALMAATWELALDGFPCLIQLPLWPVLEVEAITYDAAADGLPATLDPAGYVVDLYSVPSRIAPGAEPFPSTSSSTLGAARVEFVAGYETAADVPDELKVAVQMLAASIYGSPESQVVGLAADLIKNPVFEHMLEPFKVWI